jgi:hypothetical protein
MWTHDCLMDISAAQPPAQDVNDDSFGQRSEPGTVTMEILGQLPKPFKFEAQLKSYEIEKVAKSADIQSSVFTCHEQPLAKAVGGDTAAP